jgi:hypothetical protein
MTIWEDIQDRTNETRAIASARVYYMLIIDGIDYILALNFLSNAWKTYVWVDGESSSNSLYKYIKSKIIKNIEIDENKKRKIEY